jgi:hypothetical protein
MDVIIHRTVNLRIQTFPRSRPLAKRTSSNANQEGNIASLLARMVGAFAPNVTGRVFQTLSSPLRPPRCVSLSFPRSPEESKRAAITFAKLSSEDDPVQILVAKLALGIVARAQFNEFGHLLVNALEFR